MVDVPAMGPARIVEAGELGVRLASLSAGLVSNQNKALPKRLYAGHLAIKGVGLVREFCGEDSECRWQLREGPRSGDRSIG